MSIKATLPQLKVVKPKGHTMFILKRSPARGEINFSNIIQIFRDFTANFYTPPAAAAATRCLPLPSIVLFGVKVLHRGGRGWEKKKKKGGEKI